MTIIVTGAAGFVGMHVASRLLEDGHEVVGVDNLNDYYAPELKQARLDRLAGRSGFDFERLDLRDAETFPKLCERVRPRTVVHLAAQPGVRRALTDPHPYVQDNLVAFLSVLEGARHAQVSHLVYASSSSVYGATSPMPFNPHNPADHPVSLYAATKRANELLAHSYSHLFGLPCTGLRFFTVYGPWGRPDMAYFSFTQSILDGKPITIFGDGSALRDLTFVDDIVEGIVRVIDLPPAPDPSWTPAVGAATSTAPWRVYNIGHGEKLSVNEMIAILEEALGRDAERRYGDPVAGDVPVTHADVEDFDRAVGFTPQWTAREGLQAFVDWLTAYREGGVPRVRMEQRGHDDDRRPRSPAGVPSAARRARGTGRGPAA